MRRPSADASSVRTTALAATLVAGCAVVAFAGFGAIATPANFRERMQHVESAIAQAKAIAVDAPTGGNFNQNPLCHAPADQAAATFQQELSRDANLAKVTLTNVAIIPGTEGSSLAPIDLRFEASGPYEGILLLVNLLGASRPEVFLERVDLKPQTSVVDLVVKGRFYCSTSARL